MQLYGYQRALPGIDGSLTGLSRRALGTLGELTTWAALEAAGYPDVRKSSRRAGDLQVVDEYGVVHRVEVKTARQTARGWCWSLRRQLPDRVATDYRDSDVLVLLAVMADGAVVPFVLPTAAVDVTFLYVCNPDAPRGQLRDFRLHSDVITLPEAVTLLADG